MTDEKDQDVIPVENEFDEFDEFVDANDNQIAAGDDLGAEEEPRQNFVTGVPFDDELAEQIPSSSRKSGLGLTIGLTASVLVAALAIVSFFIYRGISRGDETVVKDNSAKMSVNSNVSTSGAVPNFQEDYQTRYGSNTNSSVQNQDQASSTASNNVPVQNGINYGSVGNITAPPPADYVAGDASRQTSSNTSGSVSSGPAPTKVSRDTSIVENAKSANASYRDGSFGRNEQSSLFFYEKDSDGNGSYSKVEYESRSAAKPDFGTVLPVRILGRIHTLGTNGLARMELTRTVEGRWGTIPRGTMFVGRVSGGEANRIFVSLIGYIDQRTNRMVTLGGDLQGTDGALGMEGSVKKLGSRWKKVFGEILSTAKQVGSAYLLGRSGGSGTVINNGQLERIPNALEAKDLTRYTVVMAGSIGYVIINDLPPAIESDDRYASAKKKLSDDEIYDLIQKSSPGEIEKMIPDLSAEGRTAAREAIAAR